MCLHLSNTLDLISSGRSFNIVELLNSIEKLLKRLHDNESDEDEDYDEDEDSDYNMDDDEDAAKTEVLEIDDKTAAEQFLTGAGSNLAVRRLTTDMKDIRASEDIYGVEGGPRGDNLFLWDVKLTDFHYWAGNLVAYANSFKEEPAISMEMKFSQDYPMAPPLVRVVKPRLQFHTGRVILTSVSFSGCICLIT